MWCQILYLPTSYRIACKKDKCLLPFFLKKYFEERKHIHFAIVLQQVLFSHEIQKETIEDVCKSNGTGRIRIKFSDRWNISTGASF